MFSQVLQLNVTLQVLRLVFTAQALPVNLTAFLYSFPQGERRLLRGVIRVADIMKVIVIRANVPRSQDTVALFASKARHLVPMGIRLIVLSLLT